MPGTRRRARCAPWSASSRPRRSPRSTRRRSSTLPRSGPSCASAPREERTIRWPRIAFWTWQPPEGGAGLLLFRGVEPQLRWRTYATLLLDVAARCGVQRIVSLGAVLEAVPHTRPPQVTGSSTDPAWQARFEACGIRTRRSRYEGPTGIATIVMDAARQRGMTSCNCAGANAPLPREHHQSGRESRAATTVAHLLDLELDVAPFEAAVRAFRLQCDQAVAKDAAVQAYVRQLEQDYDAPGNEAPRPRRDEDFNSGAAHARAGGLLAPRAGGARRLTHRTAARDRPGKVSRDPRVVAHAQASPPPREATLPITR